MKTLLVAAALMMAACGGTENGVPGAAPLPLAGQWFLIDSQAFPGAHMSLSVQPDGSFVGSLATSNGNIPIAVADGSLSLCVNPDAAGRCEMTLDMPDLESTGPVGYQWSGLLRDGSRQTTPFVANTVSTATAYPVAD